MSRLSPIVLANHCRDFAAAAKREVADARSPMSMPAYFLVARAIELGLKSYLLLCGKTEKDLRRISHDLGDALDAAKAEGIGAIVHVSVEADAAVRWINDYYEKKDLEYPTIGYKTYPQISYLIDFADELFDSLETRRRQWRP